MSRARPVRRLARRSLVRPRGRLVLAACALAVFAALPAGAHAATLSGRVLAVDEPVAGSSVRLYAAGPARAVVLGAARTDARGAFTVRYATPRTGTVIYAVASGGDTRAGGALRLLTVAGRAGALPRRLTLNELTTVAGAYALARFVDGVRVTGPAPGLPNAAGTAPNLADPATGRPGALIATAPNGRQTRSFATLRTLAAILGGCTRGTPVTCRALFAAARPPGGDAPSDTLAAIHAIARNPASNVRRIFALPKRGYRPLLGAAPSSWVLSLKHTRGGYDGPGRMAFDSQGNIWVTNNFEPPGTDAGLSVISLDPTGAPRNGSPVTGGGVKGVWWGIAVDQRDRVWLSNFVGDDTAEFYSPNFVGGTSVALFTSNARPLSGRHGIQAGDLHAPQGMAVDQRGNVWIANHGTDTVTMYPGGNPAAARVFSGGGLYNPFTIVIDAQGNAWVDNGSLDPTAVGSVTRISPNGRVTGPFRVPNMRSPQGMAIDSAGDLWIASLRDSNVTWLGRDGRVKGQFRAPSIQGAWGLAIDGDDNVWVASFLGRKVTLLCGRNPGNCPAGARTGDAISPRLHGFTNGGLQHVTAVQVDASGHAWAANNWETIAPIKGGDGLVQFIGVAGPVRTPMIGPPQRP